MNLKELKYFSMSSWTRTRMDQRDATRGTSDGDRSNQLSQMRINLAKIEEDRMPTMQTVAGILQGFHVKLFNPNNRSQIKVQLPPRAHRSLDFEKYRDKTRAGLCYADLETKDARGRDLFPKDIQGRNLVRYLATGCLQAAGRDSMLEYAPKNVTVGIQEENWELHVEGRREDKSMPIVWENSKNPVVILSKSRVNGDLLKDVFGQLQIACIREPDHVNGCTCPALIKGNNIESLSFVLSCTPVDSVDLSNLQEPLGEATGVYSYMELPRAPARVLNASLAFFGKVSNACTVVCKLACRQPLSLLARKEPVIYKPAYADINLKTTPKLLRGIIASMTRVMFPSKINYMKESSKREQGKEEDVKYRFHPEEIQRQNWDVRSRCGNLDYILSNTVHCAPFYGTMDCSYCTTVMTITGMADMIDHLMMEHKRLMESRFSCPVCVTTVLVTWDSYKEHWESVHGPSSAMIVVLDDTNVSMRLGWGLALLAAVAVTANVEVETDLTDSEEPVTFTSIRGGYAPKAAKAELLMNELVACQEVLLPEEFNRKQPARATYGLPQDQRKKMRYTIPGESQDPLEGSSRDEKWRTVSRSVPHSGPGTQVRGSAPAWTGNPYYRDPAVYETVDPNGYDPAMSPVMSDTASISGLMMNLAQYANDDQDNQPDETMPPLDGIASTDQDTEMTS